MKTRLKSSHAVLLALTLVFLLTGCDWFKEKSPIVATMDKEDISAVQFQEYLENHPLPGYVQLNTEIVKKQLNQLITAEVLYQEALAQKLDQTQKMRQRIQSLLIQELLERKVAQPIRELKITDEQIQDYFQKNIRNYERPAEVNAADIFIAAADPEKKQALRPRAEEALQKALAVVAKGYGFGELIEKYSDKHPGYPTGQPGYFDANGEPAQIGKAVAEKAFQLKIGQVSEKLIETADGFHIIMLVGQRPAVKSDWNRKRFQIEQRIRDEKLSQLQEEYPTQLREKAKIEIKEDALANLITQLNQKREVQPYPETSKNNRPPLFPETNEARKE